MTDSELNIAYVWSEELMNWTNKFHPIRNRAKHVHNLVFSYPQLRAKLDVIRPERADVKQLTSFHTPELVSHIERLNSGKVEDPEISHAFGLGSDCPIFPGVYDYAQFMAGSSLAAAKCLTSGRYTASVNWSGGWHHAKRTKSSGFCYVNDIVIAILHLLEKYERVLYLDLDLHHGDGVEEAFKDSSKVMCVSVHKYGWGFFPGSGDVSRLGTGSARYHTVNVPLKDGITDNQYLTLMSRILQEVHSRFNPQAMLIQCGVDGLNSDDMFSSFNLTSMPFINIIHELVMWKTQMMLVGGGGFNFPDTARTWTLVTAALVGMEKDLERNIPKECKLYAAFAPDYNLDVYPQKNMKNDNSKEYLDTLLSTILGNLNHVHQ